MNLHLKAYETFVLPLNYAADLCRSPRVSKDEMRMLIVTPLLTVRLLHFEIWSIGWDSNPRYLA